MKPILIYKGDDTIFADLRRFLTFNIETNLDLTDWKAKFTLGWITKEINDISSKSFEIILSSEETKKLRLGSQSGSIVLTDSRGHIKTITNSIPFEVTTQVVENEYQEIDLAIPESAEVDIKLKVGSSIVTSINGKEGDVILTAKDVGALPDTTVIPDISNLATRQELQDGLDTKQPTGDYALKSEIPTNNNQLVNGAGYITADYHDSTKQDVINDLATIRSGASKGATALQSVPAEYVTETELKSDYYTKEETQNLLDDCVHKTGAETVEGDKTFISSQGMVIERTTNNGSILKLISSQSSTNFILERTNGAKCILESGDSVGLFGTQTNHPLQIRTNYQNMMTIGTNGSVVLATDVASNSNNNQVATTKWVNNKLSNTETWTFLLEDGTEVTKTMVLGA